MWSNQPYRVEVWVEKDALVGVVEQACNPLDVNYVSCRGYMSQSEMWKAGMRYRYYHSQGQKVILIHLGDHDPSGIDMTRDIDDRLDIFTNPNLLDCASKFEVHRIALNMDQIDEYNPPPNPAKLTDSRALGYVQEYGFSSWELDALEPKVLTELITKKVIKYRDSDLFLEARNQERLNRSKLKEALKSIGE